MEKGLSEACGVAALAGMSLTHAQIRLINVPDPTGPILISWSGGKLAECLGLDRCEGISNYMWPSAYARQMD